jgi:peptidoglycan/LPS O-acetylase OafA/YrhL
MKSSSLKYMPQLDALRAFAVLAVMLSHFAPRSDRIFPFAYIGVRLFFVLSGFLITSILLQAKERSESGSHSIRFGLRRFYARRFLRIFPLYYLVLVPAALLNVVTIRETFFWHAFYLSNVYFFLRGETYGPAAHFWTLAVEEQFYLAWPLLVFLVPRRRLSAVILILVIAGPLSRLILFLRADALYMTPLTSCLDTLGLGALLALRGVADDRLRRVSLYAGLPLFVASAILFKFSVGTPFILVVADVIIGLACVWLVAGAARGFGGVAGTLLDLRPLIYLGTISYGLYVLHLFVLFLIGSALGPTRWLLRLPILIGITIAAAALSWTFFEKPINGLRRYFDYEQADTPLPAASYSQQSSVQQRIRSR